MCNLLAKRALHMLLLAGSVMTFIPSRSPRLDRSDSRPANLERSSEVARQESMLLKSSTGNMSLTLRDLSEETSENRLRKSDAPSSSIRQVSFEERRRSVLAMIRYPWEDLGYNIVFEGARAGCRARTFAAKHRIEVYVKPGEETLLQAYDLAHELGHAFDLKYNDEMRRRRWLELRGIPVSTPWFGCNSCPDYGTPAGDFAETFAFLLLGPGNFYSTLSPQPDPDQIPELSAFCRIQRAFQSSSVMGREEDR